VRVLVHTSLIDLSLSDLSLYLGDRPTSWGEGPYHISELESGKADEWAYRCCVVLFSAIVLFIVGVYSWRGRTEGKRKGEWKG
jgi:hypothetical protein